MSKTMSFDGNFIIRVDLQQAIFLKSPTVYNYARFKQLLSQLNQLNVHILQNYRYRNLPTVNGLQMARHYYQLLLVFPSFLGNLCARGLQFGRPLFYHGRTHDVTSPLFKVIEIYTQKFHNQVLSKVTKSSQVLVMSPSRAGSSCSSS